jgi:hypothetical protein
MTAPLYKHGCPDCTFLGTEGGQVDHYIHPNPSGDIIICRYSDDPGDFAQVFHDRHKDEYQRILNLKR